MPNYNNWLVSNEMDVVDPAQRAVLCWRRIQDRPTSIILNRSTTTSSANLAAQTVRIEYGETANFARNDVSGGSTRDTWVIGVKGHPTVADTDIKAGDRFAIGGLTYRVSDVIFVPGEVQARCERVS